MLHLKYGEAQVLQRQAENGCAEWEVLRVNYTVTLGGTTAAASLIVMLWSLIYSVAAVEAAGAPERWVTIILLRGSPGKSPRVVLNYNNIFI